MSDQQGKPSLSSACRFSQTLACLSVQQPFIEDHLEGDMSRQVIACVAETMLEALNEIGRQDKDAGCCFGCRLQLCCGAMHFMDWAGESQSFRANTPSGSGSRICIWSAFVRTSRCALTWRTRPSKGEMCLWVHGGATFARTRSRACSATSSARTRRVRSHPASRPRGSSR